MLELALVTYLFVLPLLILVVPPLVLLVQQSRCAVPVALGALAWLLLLTWVVRMYQGGVAADELGTRGDVFDANGWLVAAALAGLASVVIALLGRRRSPAGRRSVGRQRRGPEPRSSSRPGAVLRDQVR